MYYFLDDISELCFQALSWISEILLSIEAIHPLTGESVPIVVSPDIQNIPYTPDNEHLGMEREREKKNKPPRKIENMFFFTILSLLKTNLNLLIKLYTVMVYVPFPAIPCINDEDKSVADAMGFSYDDVVDENYIVKSGQVSFI